MCGIAGCVGHEGAINYVVDSLEVLDYRGYDSVGIAYPQDDKIELVKSLGRVPNLREHIPDQVQNIETVIGHTRWATHGLDTINNAHPHSNRERTLASAVNGMIENFHDLKKDLITKGFNFSSETDTEVIPHLTSYYLEKGAVPGEAFEEAIKKLVGAYAIVMVFASEPDTIYAARRGSPLVIGVGEGEKFVASDAKVISDNTKNAIILKDYEIARLTPNDYSIRNFEQGVETTRSPEELSEGERRAVLGNYPNFMIKEIHDSPATIRNAIGGRVRPEENTVKLGGLESVESQLKNTERLIIVGCGTSFHAGLIGKQLIEEIAEMPVEVEIASEFAMSNGPIKKDTAVLAISQSGETADTRLALEKAEKLGLLKLGLINSPGTSIERMTDAGVHCRAGHEVSVASTKAFTSQVTVLTEIALAISRHTNKLHHPIMKELVALPNKVEQILSDTSRIPAIAKRYAGYNNFLYLGAGYEKASAMEGALKLKEISYIHAEAYSAAEMKHGPLALISKDFPTLAILTDSPNYDKVMSNVFTIKAKGGPLLALASEGNNVIQEYADDVLYVPKSLEQTQPILNGVLMQLLAYYIASERGLDVDRPRHLAKSVTV